MKLRITQDCTLTVRSLDDCSEVAVQYNEGYLIENCTLSEAELENCRDGYFRISGQFPDIIFADEDGELTGYKALSVPKKLCEILGEEMKIRFLHDLSYDEDDALDTSPAPSTEIKREYKAEEAVRCTVYGWQTGNEAVDIEMSDGAVFNNVNSEIFEVMVRIPAEND